MFEYTDTTTRPDPSVPFWFELPEANTPEIQEVKMEFLNAGLLIEATKQISSDSLSLTRRFVLRSRKDFDLMTTKFQERNPNNHQIRKLYNAEHQHTVAMSIKEGP